MVLASGLVKENDIGIISPYKLQVIVKDVIEKFKNVLAFILIHGSFVREKHLNVM